MDSFKLEFFEPQLPPTVNAMGRWHWARKVKVSKLWNQIVLYHLSAADVFKHRHLQAPLDRAKLTLVRCSSVEPDYDGLVSSFKVVIDALRHNHILADDKVQNIGVPTYVWEKASPGKGGVKVVVEAEST